MSLCAEVTEEMTGDGRWVGLHPSSVTGLWKASKASLGGSARQEGWEGNSSAAVIEFVALNLGCQAYVYTHTDVRVWCCCDSGRLHSSDTARLGTLKALQMLPL